MRYNEFPFCAVAGQDKLKRALILNAVNPAIGGVLVSGEKGTAKSTLIRSFSALLEDTVIIEVPLNITEDRLVGSIDINKVMKSGVRASEPGLLDYADGNILYIDEVNLLPEHIVNIILEVSSTKVNTVERDGISYSHSSDFSLIGSMNPEEGNLRSQFIDRFGLYVRSESEKNHAARCEIIRRRLEYEADPENFIKKWSGETAKLKAAISSAKARLNAVAVGGDMLYLAAGIAQKGGCAGHRAELALTETARAICVLDGRKAVIESDIREAVEYALPHRMRNTDSIEESSEKQANTSPQSDEPNAASKPEENDAAASDSDGGETSAGDKSNTESCQDAENINADIPLDIKIAKLKKAAGSGKRAKVVNGFGRGRYVRYHIPNDKPRDIAIDATIRAAALHPKVDGEKLMLSVRGGDIREKIREKHCGATLLFCVDASASMGASRRMGAVKGAALSLLEDAYQKRDTVGIVTFNSGGAKIPLNLTRSADLAAKCLQKMKTGGKTPLSAGLWQAYNLINAARIRDNDILPYIILVSDGRANIAMSGGDPFTEAETVLRRIVGDKINVLVLDTESGVMRFGFAEKLASYAGCEYVRLDSVTGDNIKSSVKEFVSYER